MDQWGAKSIRPHKTIGRWCGPEDDTVQNSSSPILALFRVVCDHEKRGRQSIRCLHRMRTRKVCCLRDIGGVRRRTLARPRMVVDLWNIRTYPGARATQRSWGTDACWLDCAQSPLVPCANKSKSETEVVVLVRCEWLLHSHHWLDGTRAPTVHFSLFG